MAASPQYNGEKELRRYCYEAKGYHRHWRFYTAKQHRYASPQRGYYRIHFELITDDPNSMPQDSITLAYARFLEQNICLQPHTWLWTHNRWKWARDTRETQKEK